MPRAASRRIISGRMSYHLALPHTGCVQSAQKKRGEREVVEGFVWRVADDLPRGLEGYESQQKPQQRSTCSPSAHRFPTP